MNLPSFQIGNKKVRVPIIQGGMGVGVSLSNLAAAVANAGGIGVISGAQIGFRESDFKTDNDHANITGLIKEIRRARELSPNGILGVNFLVATNNYKEMVITAVKEKVDLIIAGAGLPLSLPSLVKGSNTKIAPIVSSGKAAALITKIWDRKFNYLPDAIIVEGPLAGGHLGFSKDQLNSKIMPKLQDIIRDVLDATKTFADKYKQKIPIIAAGGIFSGKDIANFLKAGADGVQMATRFVATEECDAHDNFKQVYIDATANDIQIIASPVGMPGRAISNDFVKKVTKENQQVSKCYRCLRGCNPATTPYCITDALVASVNGDVNNGLVFVGSNASKITSIMKVKDLMNELVSEAEKFFNFKK
ncbi:MAG: nitronate monooxygenase [Clostridiales bacterium]|nr:nitronate monooxygenase [Clostridiales bacterium]